MKNEIEKAKIGKAETGTGRDGDTCAAELSAGSAQWERRRIMFEIRQRRAKQGNKDD
jgi:hypothetical protein